MKLLLLLLICFLSSCCNFLYNSIPRHDKSLKWSEWFQSGASIEFVFLVPDDLKEDAEPFIEKIIDFIQYRKTFFCKLCTNTDNYKFSSVFINKEMLTEYEYTQMQWTRKGKNRYFDLFPYENVVGTDVIRREATIIFPKLADEKKMHKDGRVYIALSNYSIQKNSSSYFYDGYYLILDYDENVYYVVGRLGPIENDDEIGLIKTIVDYLAIGLGI